MGVSIAMVGCAPVPGPAVHLRTGDGSCYTFYTKGELVVDKAAGVAIIEVSPGNPAKAMPIVWPPGYTGRESGSDVEVLDGRGLVVARTGTRMEIQGGYGVGGFVVCGMTMLDGPPIMTLLP